MGKSLKSGESELGDLLAGLFPEDGHQFHVGVRRGEPRDFFAPWDVSGRVLIERARWVNASGPSPYLALEEEGRHVLEEFCEFLDGCSLPAPRDLRAMAALLEPDVLLLAPDREGVLRLRGGALVFPSGWALSEKMGQPLQAIHAPVPSLNVAVGQKLDRMLQRLAPGVAWCRDNWGIAATDELNMHPSRGLIPPKSPVQLEKLWLRVEHQALLALPHSRGLAFGIRIALHRMDAVCAGGGGVRRGLARALQTLPPELARYKRIEAILPELIEIVAKPEIDRGGSGR